MTTNPVSPTAPPGGASRFGAHYLETWQECPMLWYRRFLAPHPDGGRGLETLFTGEPLLVGSAVHEGLAAYYATPGGWKTGDYDIEAAVAHIPASMEKRRRECETDQAFDNVVNTSTTLLRKYHDWWGKGGVLCDYPDLTILNDAQGMPLVEREYEITLPYRNYVFTARFDAVVRYFGAIYVLEHKTTAASRLSNQLTAMGINTQVTGQVMILNEAHRGETIGGVMANMLVKDRVVKAGARPQFERQPFTRTVLEREKFILDAGHILAQIDEAVEEYNHFRGRGLEDHEASRQVFTMARGA